MSDPNERGNGSLLTALPPPRPLLHEPPELSARPSWQELATAFGTHATMMTPHFRAVYGELDEIRGAVNLLGKLLHEVREHVVPIEKRATGLPPMRDPDASYDSEVVAQRVDSKLSATFGQLARETPGPGVNKSPEELVVIARHTVREELQIESDKRAHKREMERLAAYEKAEIEARAEEVRRLQKQRDDTEQEHKDAKKRRRDGIAQIIVALVIATLLGAFGLLWGKSLGHDAGVAEGKALAPPVPVPVLMPAATMPTAPSATTGPPPPAQTHRP